GKPICNTKVYVLDQALLPVPSGVIGELYIAGKGVARGYLGQAGMTAERFVADPHESPGSRMYRTGDVVRWRDTGELDFLGRADQQVKIRGMRVELGEVEGALLRQAGVADAVVVDHGEGSGKSLIAYVVLAPDADKDVASLRCALAGILPDYMIPTSITELSNIPL